MAHDISSFEQGYQKFIDLCRTWSNKVTIANVEKDATIWVAVPLEEKHQEETSKLKAEFKSAKAELESTRAELEAAQKSAKVHEA